MNRLAKNFYLELVLDITITYLKYSPCRCPRRVRTAPAVCWGHSSNRIRNARTVDDRVRRSSCDPWQSFSVWPPSALRLWSSFRLPKNQMVTVVNKRKHKKTHIIKFYNVIYDLLDCPIIILDGNISESPKFVPSLICREPGNFT